MKKMLLPLFLTILIVAAMEIFLKLKPAERKEIPADRCMESLNRRNSSARSILCPSIRKGFVSSSSLFYKKRDSILFTTLILGQTELVAGLDGGEYWFWMHSFDAKSLYFCDRARLDFTELRPVMRPEVMEMMSWITELDPSSPTFKSERGHVSRISSGPFEIMVEFDSEKIISQSAYLSGDPIVTFEGSDFLNFKSLTLPTKIVATWHEERMSHKFSIEKWVVNAERPESPLPKGLRRVNLEGYSSSGVKFVSSSSSLVPGGRSE